MNNRIYKVRKILKLSQKEFAQQIGVKQNTISYIENGNISLTEQNIKIICLCFNVNEEWLRTGSGEMFIQDKKSLKELSDIFDRLLPVYQEHLIKTAKDLMIVQLKQLNND